ncbi:spore coat U domain-containing protein [bacterium]|nr:spore coat U domain-containing protein [bacterium]
MKRFQIFLLFGFSLILCVTASAATLSGTLDISATVAAAGCSSVSTTAVAFGNVSPGTSANGNGNVTVTCNSGVNYSIALDAGQHLSSSSRRMQSGSNFMDYSLFQDLARTVLWGDGGTAPGNPKNDTGNGSAQGHTVFGTASPTLLQPSGSYTDVVNVTVTF